MISTFDSVNDALARAVVYRTLSLGFQTPTRERLDQMGVHNGFTVVRSALWYLHRDGVTELGEVARRLAAVPSQGPDELTATFVRLFGHTARGRVCACETEYGADNAFHQPQQLADISGYYLAFGLRPVTASEVRIDHVACELEFMDFLNRKRAWLLTSQDGAGRENGRRGKDVEKDDLSGTLDATERAERTFLGDHLARFGSAFSMRVAAEDPGGLFGALGHVLLAMLAADCARLGIAAGPVDLVVRPEAADDAPMACGSADELIQIQRKP
jgi:TorA maturation chaperone TorD